MRLIKIIFLTLLCNVSFSQVKITITSGVNSVSVNNTIPIDITGGVIFCHGNSLTVGIGGTAYPAQLAALPGISGVVGNVVLSGADGGTTQDMIDDAPTSVDNWLPLGYSPTILVAWEIGNDIYYNGNVEAAKARWIEYCNDRRTAGWDKIISITLTPRNQSTPAGDNVAQYNAKLTEINVWLRANYASFCDGLADVEADSRLQNYNNATYFSDGTHLTTAGYGIVAAIVKTTVLNLRQ